MEFFKRNYLLILILLFATFLRLYQLDFQSVWLDEVNTMIESCPELSYKEFKDIVILREGMGYFYFLTCRILQEIFGISTYVVRFFSVLMGVAAVYYIYDLGNSLYNKSAGLIAALLLSINAFIIFYSQEARPYMLLMFAIIFSFKQLIDYIRNPSLKNALWFGFATGVIINSHFVGLSTVFSQYVLLFVIFLFTEKNKKFNLFKNGAISFIFAFLLSLNTKAIFMKMLGYKSGWMTLPGPDAFKEIFYQFFGSTELLSYIFGTLLIYFLINLFSDKNIENKLENILNNKFTFSGVILLTWFFLPIFIPIVKSYTSEPMILNRYFIGLIPPLLLAVAIGIDLIGSKSIKFLIVIVIVSFAMTDLFLVKDYYQKVNKTQFKEIASKIREKNISKSKIVSSWGWHFNYFFNRGVGKQEVIDRPIPFQSFVNELIVTPDEKPFWYLSAHFQPYQLTAESESFMNSKYNVVENIEYFDCWAKYYVPKSSADDMFMLDINKFSPIKSDNSINIFLFSNSTTKSEPFIIDAGNYRLAIKTRSLPDPPLNGQNANLAVAISGNEIGAYFASEKEEKVNYLPFTMKTKKEITIDLTFGNDMIVGKADRNILISSVVIEKVKN